jgi:hypothetical protein
MGVVAVVSSSSVVGDTVSLLVETPLVFLELKERENHDDGLHHPVAVVPLIAIAALVAAPREPIASSQFLVLFRTSLFVN